MAAELNAAQAEIVDTLGASPDQRPRFHPNLGRDLHAELNVELTRQVDAAERDDLELWVGKYQLNSIHGCEARWLDEQQTSRFTWSPGNARGAIVHKAIELSVHWRSEPIPLELVDEAIARIEHGDRSLSDYLQTCSAVERAELRSAAGDRVAAFLECFPPLDRAWHPVTEGKIRQEFAGGAVITQGRTDLTLGRAQGALAGKVIIDLKTGRPSAEHRADLRFYALLDAMKIGTPPRLLVSYYLDQGRAETEAVTEDLLASQIRRVADGVERMLELTGDSRPPEKRPGPLCRWCALRSECDEGTRFLEQLDGVDTEAEPVW